MFQSFVMNTSLAWNHRREIGFQTELDIFANINKKKFAKKLISNFFNNFGLL